MNGPHHSWSASTAGAGFGRRQLTYQESYPLSLYATRSPAAGQPQSTAFRISIDRNSPGRESYSHADYG